MHEPYDKSLLHEHHLAQRVIQFVVPARRQVLSQVLSCVPTKYCTRQAFLVQQASPCLDLLHPVSRIYIPFAIRSTLYHSILARGTIQHNTIQHCPRDLTRFTQYSFIHSILIITAHPARPLLSLPLLGLQVRKIEGKGERYYLTS